MKPIGSKAIKTAHLQLRSVEVSDLQDLIAAGSLTGTLKEAEKSIAGMVEEYRRPFTYHWVITLEGRAIGRIKAWEVAPYNGYLQLGYDMHPAHRSCGYMTEAVSAVIRYMLLEADANRVYCSVREGNAASRRVCEKCGMQQEGVLRQHYARQDGGFDNVVIYGIIRDDLKKEQSYGA